MRLKYMGDRSAFVAPCVEALEKDPDALAAGLNVVAALGPDGYSGRMTVDITRDSDGFESSWSGRDPTRAPVRLRAAATALCRTGSFGRFELTHDAGVVVIRRLSADAAPVPKPWSQPPPSERGPEASKLSDTWRRLVGDLHVHVKQGERAVYKPLLCLLIVARAEEGGAGNFRLRDIDAPLAALLREFGPPRKQVHPEYPFWYLQSDEFWTVVDRESFQLRKQGSAPPRSVLLARDATAVVPEALWRELCTKPLLRDELVSRLLNDFWPSTLHDAIRAAAGLPEAGFVVSKARRRDREFRETILRIYSRTCAVCGFDGRLGRDDLMIEAAHVRWHAEGGPDLPENGLALCTMHHASLDRGAIGLSNDCRVLVSQHLAGGELVDAYLRRYLGAKLRSPQAGSPPPALEFVGWHMGKVFRKPAVGA